jgi:hypothetical protein
VGPGWLRRPAEAWGIEKIYLRTTKLSLSGPAYDDRVIEHLARLNRLSSLTLSNTKLSSHGVARLQRALPDCQVEIVGGAERASAFAGHFTPWP